MIFILIPKKTETCGIYDFSKQVINNPKNYKFIDLSKNNDFNYFVKKFFIRKKIKILFNYTPFYWLNLLTITRLLIILILNRIIFKNPVFLFNHDYIRPQKYSFKIKILVPYIYTICRILFLFPNKLFFTFKPPKNFRNYKRSQNIKLPSNFKLDNFYKKIYKFNEINFLTFGSLQAIQEKEIILMERLIDKFSHQFKVNLILMGNSRNLNFPNFKKINCSVIRFSKIKEKDISNILSEASFALFFHNDGLSMRSGILSTCFQHGLPSIGLNGPNTESDLKEIDGLQMFDQSNIEPAIQFIFKLMNNDYIYEKVSINLQKFYQKQRSWEKLRSEIGIE